MKLYLLFALFAAWVVVGTRVRSHARVRTTAAAAGDALNPYQKDTYNWWLYALENRLALSANETFVGKHTCECDCAVGDPASESPFSCACNCPALPVGEAGEIGVDGPVGEQGLRGAQGERGEPGDKGPVGLPGAKGTQGERGTQGRKGDPGAAGRPGRSIPGPEGPPGPDGGLVFGPDGPRGPPGPRGFKGVVGEAGRDVIGPTGPRGLTGPDGDVGANGLQGAQGPRGPRGVQGPRGVTGPPNEKWQVTNLLGQITAQSSCVGAMRDAVGYVSAVIRDCASGLSCEEICRGLTVKDGSTAGACLDALHVYSASSRATDPTASGLISRRFGDCTAKDCGPNTCCCGFGPRKQ
jgi:hypothetical protein